MEKQAKSKLLDETMKYTSDEDVVLYFEKSKEELNNQFFYL